MNNLIALIPARGGSKRIPRKNIKQLGVHPLIAYTIEVAEQSCIFDAIYCSTDDLETEAICQHYGCEVIHRPKLFSGDDSPDIEWIQHALSNIPHGDYFVILRPTNPFRTVEMLQDAWRDWDKQHCLKGIERVQQHPNKMWYFDDISHLMIPYSASFQIEQGRYIDNKHLCPTQTLDQVFIQNGSLEFRTVQKMNGEDEFVPYQGFLTKGYTGLDLNVEADWIYAEWLIANNRVKLIEIDKEPWRG